jgi:hypothetical protein
MIFLLAPSTLTWRAVPGSRAVPEPARFSGDLGAGSICLVRGGSMETGASGALGFTPRLR